MEFIATSKIELESTVAFQLHKLGIMDTETLDARVLFRGDYTDMATALLWRRRPAVARRRGRRRHILRATSPAVARHCCGDGGRIEGTREAPIRDRARVQITSECLFTDYVRGPVQ